jgi:hypothetical protein
MSRPRSGAWPEFGVYDAAGMAFGALTGSAQVGTGLPRLRSGVVRRRAAFAISSIVWPRIVVSRPRHVMAHPPQSHTPRRGAATRRLVQQRVQQPGCKTVRFGAFRGTPNSSFELRVHVGAPCCTQGCGRGDSNPHALRHTVLSRACLPFHHFRVCAIAYSEV